MRSYDFTAPRTVHDAVTALQSAGLIGAPVAGATDMSGLLKNKVITPESLVDLTAIDELGHINKTPDGGYLIGATARISELVEHPDIARTHPLLHEAASTVASPQIRNQGTVGGNLCQRPRCWYYRNPATPCLRRDSTYCSAAIGENQYHAILGGAGCFIVHPSDLAVAFIALDATAKIAGPGGSRTVPMEKFFVLPKDDLHHENVLKPGEILAEIQVPPPMAGARQVWFKHRIRQVWDFAILSVALQLQMSGNRISDVRLVLGAVAPAPWRAHLSEQVLQGNTLTPDLVEKAISAELSKARPMTDNAYKIELAGQLMRQALLG